LYLDSLGSGVANFQLDNTSNDVLALYGFGTSLGNVNFAASGDFYVEGINAAAVTLTSLVGIDGGDIDGGDITADTLTLDISGYADLSYVNNEVNNLAITSVGGNLIFQDDSGFDISGFDAGGNIVVLISDGAVSQSGALTNMSDLYLVGSTLGTGAFTLDTAGVITVDTLDLRGAGGTYALNDPSNNVNTLVGNTDELGDVNFADIDGFEVAGLTAGANTVTLSTLGSVWQSDVITAGTLTLLGANSVYDFSSFSNTVTNLDVSTDYLDELWFWNSTDVNLAGVNAGLLAIMSDGRISDSGDITADIGAFFAADNILLGDGTTAMFGELYLEGNNVNITEADDTYIAYADVAGLNITSGGEIDVDGAAVTGLATFNANSDIWIWDGSYGSLNLTGNIVYVSSSSDVSIAGATVNQVLYVDSAAAINVGTLDLTVPIYLLANGSLSLRSITTTSDLVLESYNGDINFTELEGNYVSLYAPWGDVEGQMSGPDDYLNNTIISATDMYIEAETGGLTNLFSLDVGGDLNLWMWGQVEDFSFKAERMIGGNLTNKSQVNLWYNKGNVKVGDWYWSAEGEDISAQFASVTQISTVEGMLKTLEKVLSDPDFFNKAPVDMDVELEAALEMPSDDVIERLILEERIEDLREQLESLLSGENKTLSEEEVFNLIEELKKKIKELEKQLAAIT
jgi:hypothetical protein